MPWFIYMHPGDAAARWVLLILISTTLLIGAAFGIVRIFRIRSAPVRDGIWLTTLLGVLATPIAMAVIPATGFRSVYLGSAVKTFESLAIPPSGWQSAGAGSTSTAASAPATNAAPSIAPATATTESGTITTGSTSSVFIGGMRRTFLVELMFLWHGLAVFLVAVWSAVAIVLGVRLLFGWIAVWKLRAQLTPFDGPERREMERLMSRVRPNRRHPEIKLSLEIASPIVIGLVRPVIVLPADLPQRLSENQLRDVVVHEFAHVLRRDTIVGLLQRLAAIVFWPNPLVHRLNRALSRTREEVCDNYVLQFGDKHQFARALLSVAERGDGKRSLAWAVGLMDPKWRLEDRIAGLLDSARNLQLSMGRWRMMAGFALVAVALVLMGGVQLHHTSQSEAIARLRNLGAQISDAPGTGEGTERVIIPAEWTGTTADFRDLSSIAGIKELWISGVEFHELELSDLVDLERLIFNVNFYDNRQQKQVILKSLPIRTIRLKNLPKLTRLDLMHTDVGELTLENMPGVVAVELPRSYMGDDVLAGLSGAPNLREIRIRSDDGRTNPAAPKITDKGLAALARLSQLEQIVGLGPTEITDKGLAALAGMKSLKQLSFTSPHLTDAGLEHVAKLTTLEGLGLESPKLTDAALQKLRPLTKLKGIRLAGIEATPGGLKQLREFPEMAAVHLAPEQLTRETCAILDTLPALRFLYVVGASKETGVIHGLNKLVALYVEGVQSLQIEPGSLAELKTLYVSNVGPQATRALFEHFKELPALTYLEVRPGWHADGSYKSDSPVAVDDALLAHLAHLRNLEILSIENAPKVSDVGMAHLAHLKKLKRLMLPKAAITDSGASNFAELLELEFAQLGGTQISNGGLAHFSKLKKLKTLYLNNTLADEAGAARLKQDLPETEIQAYKL